MSVQIVLDGRSDGRGHGILGTFTASAPFCPEGSFVDGTGSPDRTRIRVERSLTCADGSGGVTLMYDGIVEFLSGPGRWWIVSGSGRYESLRGVGSSSNVNIEHDPQTGVGRFRNTFTGAAAFDADPPSVRVVAASVIRVARRPPMQRLRLSFRAVDAAATTPLAYELHVLDRTGTTLLARRGTVGAAVTTLTVRTRLRSRTLRFALAVRDAVGNERLVTRSLGIR